MFRIYQIETHVTNICWNHNTFLTEVQDQNLLFTFFTNDYEAKFREIAFSELVRISHRQHLPPNFFFNICFHFLHGISLLHHARDFTSSKRLSFRMNLLGIAYSCSVISILQKIFICPSEKLSTEFTSPIAKSTSPVIRHDFPCTLSLWSYHV